MTWKFFEKRKKVVLVLLALLAGCTKLTEITYTSEDIDITMEYETGSNFKVISADSLGIKKKYKVFAGWKVESGLDDSREVLFPGMQLYSDGEKIRLSAIWMDESIYSSSIISFKNTEYLADSKEMFRYAPVKAFDNDPLTSWVEGAEGNSIREELVIELEDPILFDEIVIMAGYFNEKWYEQNNRIRELILYADGASKVLNIDDGMQERRIPLSRTYFTDLIDFRIISVYSGSRYDDTCFAELSFYYLGREVYLPIEESLLYQYHDNTVSPAGSCYVIEVIFSDYYFFSDGTFVSIEENFLYEHGPPNSYQRGTWELDNASLKITIHIRSLEYGEGYGEIEFYGEGMGRYYAYENYEIITEEINEKWEMDFDEMLSNVEQYPEFFVYDMIPKEHSHLKYGRLDEY